MLCQDRLGLCHHPRLMAPISAVIIARDEEARIGPAVRSVLPWMDEVLVLDGGSRDATVAVASRAGARVQSHPFDGFVLQKQRATDLATHDLVFSLDADERVDEALGRALRVAASEPWTGRRVHRLNYLDGAPLRASGWGRDRPLRLFDRRAARWVGADPHDRVQTDGPDGPVLDGALHHDPDRTTSAFIRGTVAHARRASRSIADRGRPGPMAPGAHAAAHLLRKLVLGAALVDGRRGLTVAWVGSLGVARKYRLARSESS